jgi:hypothetical protein
VTDSPTKAAIFVTVGSSNGVISRVSCRSVLSKPASASAFFRASGVTLAFFLVLVLVGVATNPGKSVVCLLFLMLRRTPSSCPAHAFAFPLSASGILWVPQELLCMLVLVAGAMFLMCLSMAATVAGSGGRPLDNTYLLP